jgi:prepilin-type processing-associated H-X9-DG protein
MSSRLTRTACAAIVVATGLVGIPACKKKPKPTEADSPIQSPAAPGPGTPQYPTPNTSGRDPNAPKGPFFASGFEAQMRLAAEGDLRQIGMALHAYHDTFGALPTAIPDKTGKPGLSWRVAILPYMEQDNLYRQFKLDEPWDSEHNKKLISLMPKKYAPPRTDTNGYTFYRGFSGPGTWLPPQTGPRPTGTKLVQFSDGTANTILVAEAADAVIWTKPDEMEFAPNKVPQIGGVFNSGANVLLADGSVRLLRKGFDQRTLANLIQIADGNVVNFD